MSATRKRELIRPFDGLEYDRLKRDAAKLLGVPEAEVTLDLWTQPRVRPEAAAGGGLGPVLTPLVVALAPFSGTSTVVCYEDGHLLARFDDGGPAEFWMGVQDRMLPPPEDPWWFAVFRAAGDADAADAVLGADEAEGDAGEAGADAVFQTAKGGES